MSTKPIARMPPQLQKILAQLQQRFEPLAQREKVIVTAVVLALIVMLFQTLALDPVLKQRDTLQQQQNQLEQELSTQQFEQAALTQSIAAGPKRQKQQQLEGLQQELATLDEQIARTTATMIPPRKMTDVLREVMQLRENLKLVQLENLAPQPLLEEPKLQQNAAQGTPAAGSVAEAQAILADKAPAASTGEPPPAPALDPKKYPTDVGLYRHGVKLVFEGDYLSTMAFLESLEQKSWRFFWQSLQYDVEKYPKARVTLTLYTLSPERAWLGV